MYPILCCPDVDEAVDFYHALGFVVTYRQRRPTPYAVLAREDMAVHLAGVPELDPSGSLGSVIIQVPDAEELYLSFRDGLRRQYGRVPLEAIPRLLRPRRKAGTTTGFSVVDPGGNWLRFYRLGDDGEEPAPTARSAGLAGVVEVAARQGDARGDSDRALAVLDAGLARHPDAPPVERARALLYRAELLVRLGRRADAEGCLADVARLRLPPGEAATLAEELADLTAVLQAGSRRPT